jgi:hypothetical protein
MFLEDRFPSSDDRPEDPTCQTLWQRFGRVLLTVPSHVGRMVTTREDIYDRAARQRFLKA